MRVRGQFFNRPEKTPDPLEKGTQTEQYGFIPLRTQVERMKIAGRTLADFKKGMTYDYESDQEVPEDVNDPTRNPGFDVADASMLARMASDALARQKAENAGRRSRAALEARHRLPEPSQPVVAEVVDNEKTK